MKNIWEQFDESIDTEGLAEDIKTAEEDFTEYKEVPPDKYEVEINKLELTSSKKGDPMVTCWFKILEGEFANSLIFMNQVITKGFQLHLVNKLLKDLTSELNPPLDIRFITYNQYGNLILDVMEKIENRFEYVLEYGRNKKGYNTFEITQVYEVE